MPTGEVKKETKKKDTVSFASKSSWKSDHTLNFWFSLTSGKQVELNHPFPKTAFKHFKLIKNSLPRSSRWP